MHTRKLKNFKKYRDKIYRFAGGWGIKIKYTELDTDGGVYVPTRKLIKIEEDLDNATEIAVLLHELGHLIDDSVGQNELRIGAISRAYTKVYSGKPTRKENKLVVKCEKQAWNYGKKIAAALGIKLGKWYDKLAREFVKDYQDT